MDYDAVPNAVQISGSSVCAHEPRWLGTQRTRHERFRSPQAMAVIEMPHEMRNRGIQKTSLATALIDKSSAGRR